MITPSKTHESIYKYDQGDGELLSDLHLIGADIPEGWTNIPPPTPNWKPLFNFNTGKWEEHATESEILASQYGVRTEEELVDMLKDEKARALSEDAGEHIREGFECDIRGEVYHFSYGQDNQINFQDTDRLFQNNMIEEVTWNAYKDGEKVRLLLSKEDFTKIYLSGVKHKQDALSRLNDVLIPFVKSAKDKETVGRVFWDTQIESPELSIKEDKTVDKQLKVLETASQQNAMNTQVSMLALVEVTNLFSPLLWETGGNP